MSRPASVGRGSCRAAPRSILYPLGWSLALPGPWPRGVPVRSGAPLLKSRLSLRFVLFGLAAVLFPPCVFADAGTPLIWGTMLHLLVGNAFIAVFEGWLLGRAYPETTRRRVWLLAPANYLSAWVGFILLSYLFRRYATDIYSGLRVTWLLVFAAYLLTLVVEWPFVALCFRGNQCWLRDSLKGSLLIQSASYVLLFGGYWLVSGTSLYSRMRVVPPDQIPTPPNVELFYIAASDGHVYRATLGSAMDTKVAHLTVTDPWATHLQLMESPADTNHWDLVAAFRGPKGRETAVLIPSFSSRNLIAANQAWRTAQHGGWGLAPFQVDGATNSPWRFRWAHWPDVGVWARDGSRTVRIAFGVPFGGWPAYRVVQLPCDQALAQFDRQLCLLDLAQRKIALVRRGYDLLAFSKDQILERVAD